MATYSEAQIWSAIHNEAHPHLTEEERKIKGYLPLIQDLFPGINYYSISGFLQVMTDYLRPVLLRKFPEIAGKHPSSVDRDKNVKVDAFLPSDGYEHLDNPQWKKRLEELLKN